MFLESRCKGYSLCKVSSIFGSNFNMGGGGGGSFYTPINLTYIKKPMKNQGITELIRSEKNKLNVKIFCTSASGTVLILTYLNPLSANPTKWSNTLKQFVGNLPTNCLSVLDHLSIWRLKG